MPKITDPALVAYAQSQGGGNRIVATAPPMAKAPAAYHPGQTLRLDPGYASGEIGLAGGKASAEAQAREAAQRQTIAYQTQQAIAEAAAKAKIAKAGESQLDPQKMANLRAAQAQIDRIGKLFAKGPGATKGVSSLLDYLPSPANRQFDTAGAGLGEVGLAAFRVPGVGSQSDTELRAFIQANRPSASDYDSVIKEKQANLQNRLNQTYNAYGLKRESVSKKKGVIDFNDLPE